MTKIDIEEILTPNIMVYEVIKNFNVMYFVKIAVFICFWFA